MRIETAARSSAPDKWWYRDREVRPSTSLDMPTQNLARRAEGRDKRRARHARLSLGQRLTLVVVLALTVAMTWYFADGLADALALTNGATTIHHVFLWIATAAFGWIAFGAAVAIVGSVALLLQRGHDNLQAASVETPLTARTALLFPVYHEDPHGIAETISDLAAELKAADRLNSFAFFVLSDSQSDEARANEHAVFARLGQDISVPVVYRNRARNTHKKSGNIADWVMSFGRVYPQFIVFDADSVMRGETVIRLAATMQSHPGTGLIQTVPRMIRAGTIFARLQQFANNLFAPVSAAGFAAFQGASGNYWGHNAIVRTRAFASAAGLPVLEGRPPFGGPIQSHDFVEAALLRRSGWRVALITSLDGSYEMSPPTLIEVAKRDRRWMQGNLQHLGVISGRGLAPISRLHMGIGIFAYLSSALWLVMILCGLYLLRAEEMRSVAYFSENRVLFPNWPVFDPVAGLRLLGLTLLVVFTPKILGLVVELWRNGQGRHRLSETLMLVRTWVIELVVSALYAPVYMLLQCRALGAILLLGRTSGWDAQDREGQRMRFADAVQFHRWHVVIGLALGGFCAMSSWYAVAWLSPIVLGLVLSPVLTYVTSQRLGAAAARSARA
ncbi:MAG: glucans biosynthesis glucosyltransferase MdoH [Pseudomonadota bacterium]